MQIETVEQFLTAIKTRYTFPGCYPIFFIAYDGEAVSYEAAKRNQEQIIGAIKDNINYDFQSDWLIVAYEVNWENHDLYCSHTDKLIESAY